jgi:arsenate reductase
MAGTEGKKLRVLFLCTGNSARSQMAEGLLRELSGGKVEAFSAGTEPAERVQPMAVTAMAEIGIDISAQVPKNVATLEDADFDWVVTVCDHARQTCPVWPGRTHHVYWPIADPVSQEGDDEIKMTAYRETRDDLKDHIAMWLSGQNIVPD